MTLAARRFFLFAASAARYQGSGCKTLHWTSEGISGEWEQMARSIRIEVGGGFYHLMARGNRRNRIYLDDHDRRFFLKTLADDMNTEKWT